MPIEFKLKPHARLLCAISAAFPLSAYAAGAATVDFASGNVTAVQSDGRARSLAKGGEISSGETVDTGSGRAQLRFSDGALVSLSPQTQFRIDEYQFNGRTDGSEKGFFSLLKGALRTITGTIGRNNRNNYKLGTTVATIGIRGTEFSVAYGNSITVTTGGGTVEVCNTGGCLIVDSGQSAHVKDLNTKPSYSQKPAQPSLQQDPAQPSFFIAGDQRGPDGFPMLGRMVSGGSGYLTGVVGDGGSLHDVYSGFANFSETSALTSAGSIGIYSSDGSVNGTTDTAFSDGIIGWGKWSSANFAPSSGSAYSINTSHYVVGAATSSSDPVWSSGVSASYALMGFTYPTRSTDGLVGTQPVSASLLINFGTLGVTLNLLAAPLGGTTYSDTMTGTVSSSNAAMSGTSACGSFKGLLAGANAARAGLVYQFDTGSGNMIGSLTFRRQ